MNLFQRVFDKVSNDVQVDRFYTCGSLVIDVLNLWNYCNLKNRVFKFSGTERVNVFKESNFNSKSIIFIIL